MYKTINIMYAVITYKLYFSCNLKNFQITEIFCFQSRNTGSSFQRARYLQFLLKIQFNTLKLIA